jgi:hypothetical protein
LFDGALRPSEIISIKITGRDGNRLYLDDTKTGDKRIILSPVLLKAWDEYLKIRTTPKPGHEQYLILKDHHKGKGTRYNDIHAINDIVTDISRLSGLKEVTPYTIRRTSATLRLNKYSKYYMGDIKLVKDLFRHRDITTTLKYDRTTDLDIENYFSELQSTINPGETTINKEQSTINQSKATQNLIYSSPQELSLKPEEEDTNVFSFSITFFVYDVSVTCLSDGVVGDGTRYSSLLATSSPVHLCFVSPDGLSNRVHSTVEAWSVTRDHDFLFCTMPPISSYWLSVTLFISGQQLFLSGSPHYSGCWFAGRWVTGLPWPSLAVPRSPFFEQESYAGEGPSRVFCFSCFFSSLDLFPWSFSGVATRLVSDSQSDSGVLPSEQMKDVPSHLWRSNPGQVRALDLGGMVAWFFSCFPDLVIVSPPFLPMGGE